MKSKWSWNRCRPVIIKYVAAVLFVAAATLITAMLRRMFPATPGALFFCAVILSAWHGGWGPGLFASVLSTVASICLPPPLFTGSEVSSMFPRLIVFLLASLFISWICSKQKRAQTALQQAREELEQRVEERTKELRMANEELKTEIAGRKRTETLLAGQKQVLETIAAKAPLDESLARLIRLIEAQVTGMLGSILLLDEKGVHFYHGMAPSLPSEYMKAIYGLPIGPEAGSCGTAAYRKEAVFVEDIATDPRWKDYRAAALPHGLRACWSTPIFDAQRRVLGTFAMYYREPALPAPEHLLLIEMATHIAAIAISSDQAQARLRESEAKLKEAQRIANIGYWERDLIADRILWSEETYRIWGQQRQDGNFGQAELEKMIHPDDRQLQRQALADALQGKKLYNLEYRIVRPDGEVRFLHVRDEIEYDEAGRPIRLFGTVQDITERKRAEEALRESEKKFSKLFQSSPIAISLSTVNEGRYLDVNEEFLRMVQRTRDEVVGHTAVEIGIWADSEQRAANLAGMLEQGVGRNAELEIRGQFGQITQILWSVESLVIGGESCLLGSSLDITERKRAEERLFAQAQEIKAIVENSPDIIVRFDRNLRRTYVNPAFIQASGLPREALMGREIGSAAKDGAVNATAEEVAILEKSLKDVLETGRPLQFESSWPLPTDRRIFSVHLEPEFDAHGLLTSILAISRDVTEHRRAEEAVRESQQLLQQVLGTLPVGVLVTNCAGDLVLTNAAAKRIWGDVITSGRERWAQSKGFWHDTGKKLEPADWASVRALTRGETSVNELIDIEALNNQPKTILNSAAPIRNNNGEIVGAVIVNEDVTEQIKNEEKLRQTEQELVRIARLTTMGELAASIAHEVNQPLAAVVTNANAMLHWLDAVPPNLAEAREAIQRIARDGNRASEVIRRVRSLIKKSEPTRDQIDLNELVQETVALTQPELKRKKVSLQMELSPELPRIPADRVQLQQVLLNLIVNAGDSLGAVANGPRKLEIRTSRQDGNTVQIAVQDTGMGIKPQENEHLFQPFFTTKSHGLGMGLAISRSIVETHGGRLWATSNPGSGATFQFTLPVHGSYES